MLKFKVVSFAGSLLLSGCNSAPPAPATPAVDIATEQGKIRDLESAWAAAALAKDVEKSVSYYADDAILLNPGAPAAKGKDAMRAAWKDLLSDPNSKLVFASSRIEISSSGDLATTTGPHTMTMTNPKTKKPVEDKCAYLTVYKKLADGSWKVIEDVASSEIPPK